MSFIYKYPVFDYRPITVRNGSVVHFGYDPSGMICVWIRHEEDDETTTKFYIVGTGHPFDSNHIVHGSVIDGSFVWHLVEEWNPDED